MSVKFHRRGVWGLYVKGMDEKEAESLNLNRSDINFHSHANENKYAMPHAMPVCGYIDIQYQRTYEPCCIDQPWRRTFQPENAVSSVQNVTPYWNNHLVYNHRL